MTPKIMFFILLAIIVGVLTAGTFSFIHFNEILANNSDQLAKKQLELQNSYEYLSYLEKLETETDELEQELGSLTGIYPQDKLQPEFIAQIRRLATENGLIISDNTITFPTTSGLASATSQLEKSASVASLIGMPAQLTLTGAYTDQINFLKDVENFRRLVNVSSVDIQASEGGNITNTVTIDVLVQQKLAAPKKESKSTTGATE